MKTYPLTGPPKREQEKTIRLDSHCQKVRSKTLAGEAAITDSLVRKRRAVAVAGWVDFLSELMRNGSNGRVKEFLDKDLSGRRFDGWND